MALTIRCTGCRKKISVDDAFAGGVCRCPYCKEIVFVDKGGRAAAAGPRPEAPGAAGEEKPAQGSEVVTGEVLTDEQADVPMANPIRAQGIATIILIGVILAMVGGIIYLAVSMSGGNAPATPGSSATVAPPVAGKHTTTATAASHPGGGEFPNPSTPEAKATTPQAPAADENRIPRIAGMNMTRAGPIVYCIDDGKSMSNYFDYARVLARQSVGSLKPSQQTFTVMLCGKEKFMEGEYLPGGPDGEKKCDEFLQDVTPSGIANVGQAINVAFTHTPQPKTIIVLTHKEVENAAQLAQLAKERGIAIYAVALDGDAATRASLTDLANNSAGGQAITPTQAELEAMSASD